MRNVLACFTVTAAAIAVIWVWLGKPVDMPFLSAGPDKILYCVSYAPFRGSQTPLDPSTMITAAQIDDDLRHLAQITDCVRTYSVDFGLDQIAGVAAKHGLKVIQGLWLSSNPEKNRYQIDTAVALANKFPQAVRSLVVGNEVLLRGEMSATDLANTIRAVKARVGVPVTYADVWEFWVRNRDLASVVDFITIHILPYWEDFPIPADDAVAHVEAIRKRVTAAFQGKDILIGEVGWPSAGRMREGALPSPVNQAKVIQGVLALSKREHFNLNVIEAFDQPWKRALEGTVGGHWGLFDSLGRAPKFAWGQPVSNHPAWLWHIVGGILFAGAVFGAALFAGASKAAMAPLVAVSVNALVGGGLVGWTIENAMLESLGPGGWIRSSALMLLAVCAPLVLTVVTIRGIRVPVFAEIFGPRELRVRDRMTAGAGLILTLTVLLAFVVALALVFDPRYRDFPFAPLTAAVIPFVTHRLVVDPHGSARPHAELTAAIVLALSAVYILFNEGFANWQSLWLCAVLAGLVFNLWQARDGRD
ncbi:MAG TPA: beta-(1-6) glucans synthase [Pseudolabrys sp.]|nr:beta-(1-6) glucans synthase [Pseudolabrys sp.]